MEKFKTIISKAIPLQVENIDTDQIIPARFLKATTREGFGENLFRDWRYDADGNRRTSFALNDPQWGGNILVAGKNFGCGSSREHAAWALYDYGFRIIISSFYADIFRNNALNNGLLPIRVDEPVLEDIFKRILKENPEFKIDLANQQLSYPAGGESRVTSFEINAYKKYCLLNGLSDFDYLLSKKDAIETYEQSINPIE